MQPVEALPSEGSIFVVVGLVRKILPFDGRAIGITFKWDANAFIQPTTQID